MNCAYCLADGKGLVQAFTTVNGTACCRDHARREIEKQTQPPMKKMPRPGDKLQKVG